MTRLDDGSEDRPASNADGSAPDVTRFPRRFRESSASGAWPVACMTSDDTTGSKISDDPGRNTMGVDRSAIDRELPWKRALPARSTLARAAPNRGTPVGVRRGGNGSAIDDNDDEASTAGVVAVTSDDVAEAPRVEGPCSASSSSSLSPKAATSCCKIRWRCSGVTSPCCSSIHSSARARPASRVNRSVS